MIAIDIPNRITITVKEGVITTRGALGENSRKYNDALLIVKHEQGKVTIDSTEVKALKKKAAIAERSLAKEITNDINGVTKHYEIRMQSLHAHFPLTVEVKDRAILLKNMIGERAPRIVKIMGKTNVEVKGQDIRIYGTSLDDVTQTAANIRKASKIRRKDERVFQDGVYYAMEE